jgi:hypothetical protein
MGKTKAIISSYVGVLLYSALVFLGAWKIDYWQGLLYVVLALVGTTMSHILVPAGSSITGDRAREARQGETGISGCLGRFSWSRRDVPGSRAGLRPLRLDWRCRLVSLSLGQLSCSSGRRSLRGQAGECLFQHSENPDRARSSGLRQGTVPSSASSATWAC